MRNIIQNNLNKISVIAFIGIIFTQSNILSFGITEITTNLNIFYLHNTTVFHDPILIDGNDELATFIGNEGLSGSGSYDSPYIIEDFTINASTAHGIEINNTDAYLIIQNCTVKGGYNFDHNGIFLNNAANVNINNNILINNHNGIYLFYSSNIALSGNNPNNNEYGIVLDLSSNNTLSGNNVNNSDFGIILTHSNNNTLSGNNASYNIYHGIHLLYSSNNILTMNNANNNSHGISLYFSSNYNALFGNKANNNDNGIFLCYSSNNNTLFGNNVSYNDYGISLFAHNNTIYFNDIYGNYKREAYEGEECTGNQWDNGTIGNYWGDYVDKYPKAKKNSIFWKTPYEIDGDGSGIDNFPLVNSITLYDTRQKIMGFPLLNVLIFISVGVFLIKRKITNKMAFKNQKVFEILK